MPLYEYACLSCERHTDAYRSVAERNDAPACPCCGGRTRKVISLSRPIGDMAPYYDENLEAFVKSRQHRKVLMKERGVSEKYGMNWYTASSAKPKRVKGRL